LRAIDFACQMDITKTTEEEGLWIVEGFAATSDFDMQEDVITQEAIEGSVKDLVENSTVLLNHNSDEAIGKVLASEVREGGLFLKILISKTAADIWKKITEGVLNKFSVRGRVLEARKQWMVGLQRFARMIFKMQLVEVSLVAVPANPKARAVRWYVEKALSDYEADGGEIEEISELCQQCAIHGGDLMEKDNEITETIEEELLEAKDNPPDVEANTPNPSPAPATEPTPNEKPKANVEKEDNGPSPAKLSQLKRLLAQLQQAIEGMSSTATEDNAEANNKPPSDDSKIEGKMGTLVEEVKRISDALGLNAKAEDGKEKPASPIAEAVKTIAKRLDTLEGTPGARDSLEGQETLPGDGDGTAPLWKGIL